MQVLADSDQKLSDKYLRQEVDYICQNKPGISKEFKRGVEFLNELSSKSFLGKGFSDLNVDDRNKVLKKILREYPSRFNNANWRLKTRLTTDNFDLLMSSPTAKNFRNFVVRELLLIFYRSKSWLGGCWT